MNLFQCFLLLGWIWILLSMSLMALETNEVIPVHQNPSNNFFSNSNFVFPESEHDRKGYHSVYLNGIFFFGSSGDDVFSGLYIIPVGGGGEFGYTYNDDFMKYHLFLSGYGATLFSPYEKINPGYEVLDELLIQSFILFSSSFSVWKNSEMNLKIGPGFHFYGDNWIYNDSEGIESIIRYTWFFHTGLGLDIFWHWKMTPQHHMSLSLYLPLLNIGWRPAYALFTFQQEWIWEEGKILKALFQHPFFMSFHNFIFLDFRFDYKFFFSQSWALNTTYHGILQFTNEPRKRLDIHNKIHLGVSFHW